MYIFHCFPHKIKTHYHQVDQVTQTSENGHCESNDNTKKTVFKLDLHCFLVFSLLTKKVSYFMIFFSYLILEAFEVLTIKSFTTLQKKIEISPFRN